jgi:EmrB/QacA subfamily drug resistance transporter
LFFIVLPIAVIDVLVAAFLLKNVTKRTFPKIDIPGIIFSTLGFGGILYGCSSAGNVGWTDAEVLVSLSIGVVALILFVWRELTVENPMLNFEVFKYGIFSLTTVINVVVTMAMFSAMILVPFYLQNIRGFTPLESGLLLLPGAIIMGIMSPITGMIFDKIGARWLAVTGLSITALTTWMFSHLTDSTSYMHLIIMYSARMFGMSMLMMPIMTAGLNQLPKRLNPHGTAMSNTMRQVSGAIGTAYLVTVMTNQTQNHLKHIMISAGISPDAKQQVALALKHATIQGINDAFVIATWLTLIALALSFFIGRPKIPEEDRGQKKSVRKVAVDRG